MCEWLHENGFWIMADVSPLTLERFQEESLSSLSRRLHLNNVRLDFGFDLDKLKREELAVSFTYNASTLLEQGVAQRIVCICITFIHVLKQGLITHFSAH